MRAALHARVSTEEQVDGYSLDAQKRAFRSLVQQKGWTVYHEYVEEGRSAHTDNLNKRPVFKEAIEYAEAGRYDVLVVHKIDRFSRKLRVTLECFERLGKAGVGFVAIENDIDYTTPTGKLMLVMQGGLAEFYSQNLSLETKKGYQERKAQGLHSGPIPFGAKKGPDGVPVRDDETFPGLRLMFELTADGMSSREVSRQMNARGFRTTASRAFRTGSVQSVLTNRFYLGEIRDEDGWKPGKHMPFIPKELWERATLGRERHRSMTYTSTGYKKKVRSLSGIAYCWHCGGRIHVQNSRKGMPRLGCYGRVTGSPCTQPVVRLAVYEDQMARFLEDFHIPGDYQAKVLKFLAGQIGGQVGLRAKVRRLEGQLRRIQELYEWGDYTKPEYHAKRAEISNKLEQMRRLPTDVGVLTRLAELLASVGKAWACADGEQRNRLARSMFDQVWIEDRTVLAVRPRPELEPFFKLDFLHRVKGVDGSMLTSLHPPARQKRAPYGASGRMCHLPYRSSCSRKLAMSAKYGSPPTM